MKIACPRGNVNGSHPLAHNMTAGDVEQLVYILAAFLADEETSPSDLYVGEDSYSRMECPLERLHGGRHDEAYAEVIESMVEQRRRAA